METKLLQAEKLRGLGEMAGGVAHDFNNVLAAILGRAQLLKLHLCEFPGAERRKSYAELKQGLEVIERAAADGAETVRRVQEFARIRPDDKDMTAVNINEALEHAIEFTRVRWKDEAELKGIHYAIEKQLLSVPAILGSAAEMREVLTNLINNALDAMPDGGAINIKTFVDKNQVCMLVSDSGSGMPRHISERIFDPFFTTKGPQSTGLGMSVSYGIVTRHQGTISVDSEEGKGTTFTLRFPVREVKKQELDKAPEAVADAQKATILIIEDEEDVRSLLQDILTMQGHQVALAHDGREGVELFTPGAFDLVFSDLGMPGMSGWEVAKAIRLQDSKVAIAIITGWDIHMDKKAFEESGVNLIIQKPFTVDAIVRLVRESLAIKKAKESSSG
jgi:CheY-like chemotaxis protein/anti-sigma regulatory factor (Ser/Thr protein kinase)